jgi:competence protein ComEC
MGLSKVFNRGIFLVGLLTWFLGIRFYDRFWNPNLIITFFDVGQGDSALVQFPFGETLLVDGGGGWKNWDVGTQVLFPELSRLGILTLDHLLLSHPDNDHGRGFLGIINLLKVKELWLHGALSNLPKKELLKEIEEKLAKKNILEHFIRLTKKLIISGVEVSLIPLHPQMHVRNNQALVMKLKFGKCQILFSGDIEEEGEKEITKKYPEKINLLKVPHHGSLTSSHKEFLTALSPDWAVVSVGANNNYGHPKPQVLKRYREMGIPVFRTDFHGAVRFIFTPEGQVKCETIQGDCGQDQCSTKSKAVPFGVKLRPKVPSVFSLRD